MIRTVKTDFMVEVNLRSGFFPPKTERSEMAWSWQVRLEMKAFPFVRLQQRVRLTFVPGIYPHNVEFVAEKWAKPELSVNEEGP